MKFAPEFACEIRFRIKARVAGEGERYLENSRQQVVPFDETVDFHGIGQHWSADELFLGSLLASLGNTLLYFARKRRARLGPFHLQIDGDVCVCYHEDVKAYRIDQVTVSGALVVQPDQVALGKRLWELTVQACHILHSINKQVAVVVNVDVKAEEG